MDPIDLRSDTVTRPSSHMRRAIPDAEVGTDTFREDPTVKKLEDRVATRLEMEDALYFPTGTMANQAAIHVHTDRGQKVICDEQSHVYRSEAEGIIQRSRVEFHPVDGGDRGVPSPGQIKSIYRDLDINPEVNPDPPGIGVLALENTHNARGGLAIAPGQIDRSAETAAEMDLPTHLDGSRLWNAAVALDVPVARFTRAVDSVMVALSKGLGAPVGSLLAGDEEFIEQTRQARRQMGGEMSQVGIVAAPALNSLNNTDRLETDHKNAAFLARGINKIDEIVALHPETNIVLVDISGAELASDEFLNELQRAGVLGTKLDEHLVRFVTHRDVTRKDIERAVDRIGSMFPAR